MAWLDARKLAPPAPPAGWLPRTLLPTGPWPAVVALVAGPGWGKTLGLRAIADQVGALGGWTAWLTADALDLDAGPVFDHLAAAVRSVIPGFDPGPAPVPAGDQPDYKRWWARFFAALAPYQPAPGLWLLIDDLHQWDEALPGLVEGLRPSLERLPPGVHVAISARRAPPLGLAKLVARGAALQLGPEALGFTPAEAHAAFGTAPEACARLDGWPLGLALTAGGASLSAYVAEEYVEAQPADLRALLPKLALVEPLTPAVLAEVRGLPDPVAVLARLEAAHLARRWEDGSYRLPGFLAAALRADAAPDPGLHARAARHAEAAGRPEAAIAHALAAGEVAEAARIAWGWFPLAHAHGRAAAVASVLDAFPPAAAGHPVVRYGRAQLAWRAGDHAQAEAGFAQALAGFEAAGDAAGALRTRLRLLTHAVVHERETAALEAALAPGIAGAPAADRADWGLVRAHAAEQRGDLAAWGACNREVLALPVAGDVEVATCAAFARLNLYNLAQHQGDLAAADGHLDAARKLADAWGFGALRLYAGFMQAHLRVVEGRPDQADAWFRGLEPGWADGLDWHDRGCALTALGAWHLARGEEREGEKALVRALAVFEEAGTPVGKKVPLVPLLELAGRRKQPDRLARWLAEAGPLDGASAYDLALRLAHARGLDLTGQPGAAEALDALAADAAAAGAGFVAARARLYAAAAWGRRGERARAEAAQAEALRALEAGGWGFLREQDAGLWAALAPQAAPAGGLRLRLLGGFEAWVAGVRVERWPRRKAQVLLAALALHPRGLPAFDLGELMAQPAAGVQNCASALRAALAPLGGAPLRFEAERYRLADGVLAGSDVADVEAALARARTPGADAAAAWAEAVAAYGGPLLDADVFAGAFDAERADLEARVLAAVRALVAHHVGRAEEAEAARWLAHGLGLAPCDEELVVEALGHYGLRRDAERVRAAYWDHRKALKRRLGLAPGAAVEAAYRAALAGR